MIAVRRYLSLLLILTLALPATVHASVNAIHLHTLTGSPVLDEPRGVSYDADGLLYVTSSTDRGGEGGYRIHVFAENGSQVYVLDSSLYDDGELTDPFGLAASGNRLYVADRGGDRIAIFENTGGTYNYSESLGEHGDDNGKFIYPEDVHVDASGVYVADTWNHRIQVFDVDHSLRLVIGDEALNASDRLADGQFYHPGSVVADYTGRIFVADSGEVEEPGHNRIQVFNADGAFQHAFGEPGSGPLHFSLPQGVTVDDDGRLYIADTGNNRVKIYNPDLQLNYSFGSGGTGTYSFNQPWDVAYDPARDRLAVADSENDRVLVYALSYPALPELTIGAANVFFNDSTPVEFKTVNVTAQVDNIGYQAVSGIAVTCAVDDETAATFTLDLPANSSVNVSFAWLALGIGAHTVTCAVDTGDAAAELNELNNNASANLTVTELLPDKIYPSVGNARGVYPSVLEDRVWVSDYDGGLVRRFTYAGSLSATIGAGILERPVGLARDTSDRLYVASRGNNSFVVLDTDNALLVSNTGRNASPLYLPHDVAVSRSDAVYVADSGNGRFEVFAAYPGFSHLQTLTASFAFPYSIAHQSDGSYYVSDRFADTVTSFSSAGVIQNVLGGTGSGAGLFDNPRGIAVDLEGRLYVADGENDRIQIFNSDGTHNYSFTGRGNITDPWDVAVDDRGNVFVATGANVQRYFVYAQDPAGITLASPAQNSCIASGTVPFSYSVSYPDLPANCTLWVNGVESDSRAVSNVSTQTVTVYGFPDGWHRWNVTCTSPLRGTIGSDERRFQVCGGCQCANLFGGWNLLSVSLRPLGG